MSWRANTCVSKRVQLVVNIKCLCTLCVRIFWLKMVKTHTHVRAYVALTTRILHSETSSVGVEDQTRNKLTIAWAKFHKVAKNRRGFINYPKTLLCHCLYECSIQTYTDTHTYTLTRARVVQKVKERKQTKSNKI